MLPTLGRGRRGLRLGSRLSRGISRVTTARRRRNNRRRSGRGIEINHADGGYKSITIPYRTQGMGINVYGRLLANKIGDNWEYKFAPENENWAPYSAYNLVNMLNWSNEFTDRLKTSSQYLLKGIRINISYNRVPNAGDRLSKLLLSINTSKVQVQDPKIQNNVMSLNMNALGTKNFNFNINTQNMPKDFVGWQEAENLYSGTIYLHLDSQDLNYLNTDETTMILGTVKITFSILTRIQDYMKVREPTKKKTIEEEINDLKALVSGNKQDDISENKNTQLSRIDEVDD
jgi:hypothetical protein